MDRTGAGAEIHPLYGRRIGRAGKERQQAEEAARLPETIASLTCQLTDLQLALCELYEGGGV